MVDSIGICITNNTAFFQPCHKLVIIGSIFGLPLHDGLHALPVPILPVADRLDVLHHLGVLEQQHDVVYATVDTAIVQLVAVQLWHGMQVGVCLHIVDYIGFDGGVLIVDLGVDLWLIRARLSITILFLSVCCLADVGQFHDVTEYAPAHNDHIADPALHDHECVVDIHVLAVLLDVLQQLPAYCVPLVDQLAQGGANSSQDG